MEDNGLAYWNFLAGIVLGIALTLIILTSFDMLDNYQDGQIDAINGEIYYELQKQDDNSMEWTYVPEGVKE